jgi:ubiquinone/menaquinone biosynthesis C-methylase UbiE
MTLVNLNNQKEKALSEMKRILKDNGQMIISVYSEKAIKERKKMYEQVEVPIKSELNGKFIFDTENFTSEQFSISDIKKIIKPIGLKIIDMEEVENLAYIFKLKMI